MTRRGAAWRLIAGGALVAFSIGTYLGHQATTEDGNPEHPVVQFERAHPPQETQK